MAPRTMRFELMYFKSVFNKLIRLGEWKHNNSL
ncbi:phage integrase [Gilliamella sp. Fer4-1]